MFYAWRITWVRWEVPIPNARLVYGKGIHPVQTNTLRQWIKTVRDGGPLPLKKTEETLRNIYYLAISVRRSCPAKPLNSTVHLEAAKFPTRLIFRKTLHSFSRATTSISSTTSPLTQVVTSISSHERHSIHQTMHDQSASTSISCTVCSEWVEVAAINTKFINATNRMRWFYSKPHWYHEGLTPTITVALLLFFNIFATAGYK